METEKKRGPGQAEKEAYDESGHSEKQADLDAEVKAGEWQRLKRFTIYQQRSRQWRIIVTHQAVTNRLNQLNKMYYPLVGTNPKKGAKLLEELKRLRLLQDLLLNILTWEDQGETITDDMLPEEIRKIIG